MSFGFVVALGSACSNSERSGDGTNGDSADGATAGHGTTAGNSAGAVTPPATPPPDEDGYALWLRYPKVTSETRLAEYRAASAALVVRGRSPTLDAARAELERGLGGLLGSAPRAASALDTDGSIVLGTLEASPELAAQPFADTLLLGGDEAFVVQRFELDGRHFTAVVGNTDRGVLYGSFALLRHLARQAPLAELELDESPRIVRRVLDHWDNLDRSVERGYAGSSLWDWAALPGGDMTRYVDYARANASLGINGSVLTNVNANAQVLTPAYLERVRALADVFRPYGIAVYLTARFSAPIEIGGLATADPLAPEVQSWWSAKADEIYALIPDFGGFVVKANSEGQPGPREYGRTHAEGANLLADALAPHGGIVMWRAFVYSDGVPTDRIRQAYDEFEPLDASFRDNVLVQVKNGPLDFQPREPYHPLFGAMPETPIALELQITKEYLGQDTHLAYLGPLFEEVLDADTFAEGPGSTVARVVDGSLHDHALSAIAGVANIGSDRDWTGSQQNAANWYAYGRLAWDPDLGSAQIAEEWVRQTFSNEPAVVAPVTEMLMSSRETLVDYMTPLGLTHIMATSHHYGPGPWVNDLGRADWNPVYYHRADATGIGFDRTATGSDALAQYFPPVRDRYASRASVPDNLLLFFHRVGWNEVLRSGRTLWDELVFRYDAGVAGASRLGATWATTRGWIDKRRFDEVASFLRIQADEARWWRDAALAYFGQVSGLPLPAGAEPPAHPLEYYQSLRCPTDRTRPRCEAMYTSPAP
ncbi:MAG TPA: alpha-glucuronidase family glycosyl hydrolase [Polyangiaceae bacterium]|nr:alpha-glucuronidase family glycosyl hydrolase [Polyangiaceae bacterium]